VQLLDFSLAQFVCVFFINCSDQVGVGVAVVHEHPVELEVEDGRQDCLDTLHWHGGWFSILILLIFIFSVLVLLRVQVPPDLAGVLEVSLGALADEAELNHDLDSSDL